MSVLFRRSQSTDGRVDGELDGEEGKARKELKKRKRRRGKEEKGTNFDPNKQFINYGK